MEIIVSARARKEINEIARYIAGGNKSKGQEFIQLTRETFLHISRVPYTCAVIRQNIRRKILHRFTNYAVLYEIKPGYVEILTVYHMSRINIRI